MTKLIDCTRNAVIEYRLQSAIFGNVSKSGANEVSSEHKHAETNASNSKCKQKTVECSYSQNHQKKDHRHRKIEKARATHTDCTSRMTTKFIQTHVYGWPFFPQCRQTCRRIHSTLGKKATTRNILAVENVNRIFVFGCLYFCEKVNT